MEQKSLDEVGGVNTKEYDLVFGSRMVDEVCSSSIYDWKEALATINKDDERTEPLLKVVLLALEGLLSYP